MKFKIHYWILIGFVLGILAGVIFKADEKSILIEFKSGNQVKIAEIHSVKIVVKRQETYDTINANNKVDLINIFKRDFENVHSILINDIWYNDVAKIKSDESVLKFISPLGNLFLRLLSFLAIPLVIASMIVGVASLGNAKALGRVGLRTIFFYLVTTCFAVLIGLTIAKVIEPGKKISEQVKSQIEIVDQSIVEEKIKAKGKFDIIDFLVNVVPSNPFKALSQGEMLQIIFLSIFFGMGLTFLEEAKRKLIIDFFDGVSQVFIRMVRIVLWFAPIGVFALISVAISDFGVSILSTLGYYMFAVVLGLFLQFTLVYSMLVWLVGKTNPLRFYSGMREAFLVAFTTSSSAATLPVTFQCVEENLKVPKEIASFVLPLGATINMDGTSLYQCVAAVFIAQFYGLDLSFAQLATIFITSVLASIGTAPVPGVGIIMLVMILQSVGIPPQGIGLILGVDRILDMLRTIPNVTGDAAVSFVVSKLEKK